MDRLKIYKTPILIALFSITACLTLLNYLFSNGKPSKNLKKQDKIALKSRFSSLFLPFKRQRFRRNDQDSAEISHNPEFSLYKALNFGINEGSAPQKLDKTLEIFEKTGESLEKLDYKALSFAVKARKTARKQGKAKKKLKKNQYLQLREQRNQLKTAVNELYEGLKLDKS